MPKEPEDLLNPSTKIAIRLKFESWENLLMALKHPDTRLNHVANSRAVINQIQEQLDEIKKLSAKASDKER